MSSARMRVAGAPVSFGVDEIMVDDAWMPGPEDVLDWLVDIGVEGTELGPPGYLGDAEQLRQRLSSRGWSLWVPSCRSISAGTRWQSRIEPGSPTA